MNAIRSTQALNKLELESAVAPSASWHADYRDTAYIYIGGLPLDLSEGDVLAIFSQYGNPTHLNLVREKDTGKSRGFAFLKYEDQRSCDLAVDNLGGAEVLGRLLRVDHTRYKKKEGEDEDTWRIEKLEGEGRGSGGEDTDGDVDAGEKKEKRRPKKPMLKEERELEETLAITQGEEEDPMREYLIREKREEVQRAREREKRDARERKHRNHHRHHRRGEDRRDDGRDERRDERDSRRRRDREDEEQNDSRSDHGRRRDNEDEEKRESRKDRDRDRERRRDYATRDGNGNADSRADHYSRRSRSP